MEGKFWKVTDDKGREKGNKGKGKKGNVKGRESEGKHGKVEGEGEKKRNK